MRPTSTPTMSRSLLSEETTMIIPRLRRRHLGALAVRVALLLLVAGLSVRATGDGRIIAWFGLLAVAGLPAVLVPAHPVVGPLARLAEVLITALAVVAVIDERANWIGVADAANAVLPYLPVPVGAALVTLALVGHRHVRDPGYLTAIAEWLLISALACGVAIALQESLRARTEQPAQPYAEATRLLTQLRTVARQLPGATLDPGGLAEHLLDELRMVAPATRAAVLSVSGGGRLVVLAQRGAERVDWETALDADSAIADAWASQQPQTAARSQARSVVPLVAGVRTVGLIALETDTAWAYPPLLVSAVVAVAAPAALRLEAALLFDEVRSLATSEERQRLAREIHDGVAQELVMVGYGIDNAIAALPNSDAAADELRALRAEVTRVITELRLSLFELRSEVDRYGGLAAAIADYARTVGSSAGLRVHLSLDESTARLPAASEAELLRIAQEAITNARKHAGAENLWVTCEVDPPFARVEVSDDGHGIGEQPVDGRYGLAIMAERAERIRGRLEVRPRVPSGTTVAVVLGSSPRRG